MSLKNHDWREVIKILSRHGFRVDRQRGSHIMLEHDDGRHVTVPRQNPIKEGVLKSILEQAGISRKEFLDSL